MQLGRIAWKVHYQMHLVPCEFFSVGLDNAGGISDEMKLKLYFKPTGTINITLSFKHIG